MASVLTMGLVLAAAAEMQVSAFVPAPMVRPLYYLGSGSGSGSRMSAAGRYNGARRRPRCIVASTATPTDSLAGGGDQQSPAGAPAEAPAAPSAPSYRRLYDSAMQLLEKELELTPYPVPEGLEKNSAVVGKGRSQQSVETSITAFRSPKFRQIRAALVETDGPTQILNFVMFPHPSYDLPIFGVDLVSLPGVHIVCIDLQPAHGTQKLDGKRNAALEETKRQHLDGLPWGGDLPEAARKYFSPHCIWSKLGPAEDVEEKVLEAMMDYLREYLSLASDAEPEEADGLLAEIKAGHAEYSDYRRVNDPGRGMLTRFFGSEWTESALDNILFDFML